MQTGAGAEPAGAADFVDTVPTTLPATEQEVLTAREDRGDRGEGRRRNRGRGRGKEGAASGMEATAQETAAITPAADGLAGSEVMPQTEELPVTAGVSEEGAREPREGGRRRHRGGRGRRERGAGEAPTMDGDTAHAEEALAAAPTPTAAPTEAPEAAFVAPSFDEPAAIGHPGAGAQAQAHDLTHEQLLATPVRAQPYELPMGDLSALARDAGLEWVNSDADKIRAAQAAIASEPRPTHVPRERKPLPAIETGPLVLVETRKDLSQLRMPFDA